MQPHVIMATAINAIHYLLPNNTYHYSFFVNGIFGRILFFVHIYNLWWILYSSALKLDFVIIVSFIFMYCKCLCSPVIKKKIVFVRVL